MEIHPLSTDVGTLTVVYDAGSGGTTEPAGSGGTRQPAGSGGTGQGAFCAWCRAWLESQPLSVPVRFTPAGGPEATARLGVLGTGAELVVLADDGRAWTGAAAFVMCLWATTRHRDLAYALRLPVARMGAEAFFHALTANRAILDRLLSPAPAAPRPAPAT
jgi:predicted DCC family thiol-disulfide oxidoreductase YuxK